MATHKVVSGDTLYSISRKYGLTVDELKSLNKLSNNNLKVGQILVVKKTSTSSNATSTSSTTSSSSSGGTHTVKKGDTLFSIAKKYGITTTVLKTLNALKSNVLKLGQILKIGRTNTSTTTSQPATTTATDSITQQKIQFGVNFTGGTITGMNDSETRAYAANVAYTESRFRAQVENAYGYIGLYQFGAVALVEAGLINRNKYNAAVKIHGGKLANGANASVHKAFIADSSNWNSGYSKQQFLNNPSLQHKAFVTYTNNNIQYASAAAKRAMNGNIAKIASYMKMAHLLGPSRASEGTVNPNFDASDKNQTSMQEYGLGVANEIKTLSKQIEAALKRR